MPYDFYLGIDAHATNEETTYAAERTFHDGSATEEQRGRPGSGSGLRLLARAPAQL
jgi:hypothetical protein